MAFPKRARRKIIIDGMEFSWMLRNKPTWNEITESPYLIPIQHDSAGTLLRANIGYCRSEYVDRTIPVVTPAIIERIIRFAIASGWEYEKQNSKPLELDCSEIIIDEDETWEAFSDRATTR